MSRTHTQSVLRALKRNGPMSDWALTHVVQGLHGGERKPSPSSIRSRRAELCRAGLVVNTGRCEFTPSGRRAAVWKAAS